MSRNCFVIFSVGLLSLLLILGVPPVQAEGKSGEKAALYPPAPTGVRLLMVGTQIPPVNLKTSSGQPFDLGVAIADKPAVMVFYRGNWCPHCNRQLAQLQGLSGKLSEMGYQILGISPDSPEKLQGTIQKHGLTFPLLSDGRATSTSGARSIYCWENGLISFNYMHPNYRVRLDPDVLLAAAKAGLKE